MVGNVYDHSRTFQPHVAEILDSRRDSLEPDGLRSEEESYERW